MTEKYYSSKFKCRCMSFLYQKISITSHMSGTWKVHMSLEQSIMPYGLHRVFYQLKDNDLDNLLSDDEDVWIEKKFRRRHDFRNRWY